VRGAPSGAQPTQGRAALLTVGLEAAEAGTDERRAWASELGWRHGRWAPGLNLESDADWKAEFDSALEREDWPLLLSRLETLVVADLAKTVLPEIEAVLAAGPPQAERDQAQLLLGRAWRVRKQNAKALSVFKRVGESDAVRYARARYAAALAARSLKRKGESRRLLEQAAAGPVCLWRDRALERLADQDIAAGRRTKARERWQLLAAEAETPSRRADAAWRRAWSFFDEGETDRALAAFTAVSADFPRHHAAAAGLYWSQRLLSEGGAPEEARRRLEQLADEHPWDYYGLLAARELGRTALRPYGASHLELESVLAELLEEAALTEEDAAERAAAEWRTGFPAALLSDLEQVEALPPPGEADEAGAWAMRVALLGESGRHRAALVELRTALPDWRTRKDVPALAWAGAYPRAYSELVEHHAGEVELDPALVYALIHQESVFDPDAVSHAGARGLMQIMPGTNRTIARWFKERTRTDDLLVPEHNVRYGTAYLKRLLDNLEHPELALAGYNAGGTRARRWWKALPEKDLPLFVESIPYDETRHYVKAVTWNRHFYGASDALTPAGEARSVELR
jgi:soluble lytic murein transglycosylase